MKDDKPKGKRGFGSMSIERRREIAAMGGRAVPADKRSYSQNPDLAASAGRKGGENGVGRGKNKPKAKG